MARRLVVQPEGEAAGHAVLEVEFALVSGGAEPRVGN
jgi:hypothetical protein